MFSSCGNLGRDLHGIEQVVTDVLIIGRFVDSSPADDEGVQGPPLSRRRDECVAWQLSTVVRDDIASVNLASWVKIFLDYLRGDFFAHKFIQHCVASTLPKYVMETFTGIFGRDLNLHSCVYNWTLSLKKIRTSFS